MTIAEINSIALIWIGIALVLVPVQLKVTAPYGRHSTNQWGPTLPYRAGWILMEIVSPLMFCIFFLSGNGDKPAFAWIAAGLWACHYLNRSLIYPFRAKMEGKRIPLAISGSAIFFNSVNGFLNGYYLGNLASTYPGNWLFSWPFWLGLTLFILGFGINLQSDNSLISLRKPGETGYKMPQNGLFRWISCPNHFGEIIEWSGFAVLCWNLPALSFAAWTAANLIPRAISHHHWYKAHFDNYPAERKAVIPFVL